MEHDRNTQKSREQKKQTQNSDLFYLSLSISLQDKKQGQQKSRAAFLGGVNKMRFSGSRRRSLPSLCLSGCLDSSWGLLLLLLAPRDITTLRSPHWGMPPGGDGHMMGWALRRGDWGWEAAWIMGCPKKWPPCLLGDAAAVEIQNVSFSLYFMEGHGFSSVMRICSLIRSRLLLSAWRPTQLNALCILPAVSTMCLCP